MGLFGIIPTIKIFSSDGNVNDTTESDQQKSPISPISPVGPIAPIAGSYLQDRSSQNSFESESRPVAAQDPASVASSSTMTGGETSRPVSYFHQEHSHPGGAASKSDEYFKTGIRSLSQNDRKASMASIDPLSQIILSRASQKAFNTQGSGPSTGSTKIEHSTTVSRKSSDLLGSTSPKSSPGNSQVATRHTSVVSTSYSLNQSSTSANTANRSESGGGPISGSQKASLARNSSISNRSFVGVRASGKSSNKSGGGSKFLSRLLRTSSSRNKNDEEEEDQEEEETNSEPREEGWKAGVLGYIPTYPTPPKYIWVRSHKKTKRDFQRVFLAQELSPPKEQLISPSSDRASSISTSTSSDSLHHKGGAIWVIKFSVDGKYMASAGEDKVVRIWEALSNPSDRDAYSESSLSDEEDSIANGHSRHGVRSGTANKKPVKTYAPIFKSKPVREFLGHTATILDLSWSKNNFLLSSSTDKTVRLWHIGKKDCIFTFSHRDFVTSIAFHPKDDRFFLSGSLDCKVRLWSIPDKNIAYSKEVPDLITAVTFTPEGDFAIVGCFGGQCLSYETDGLVFQSQMIVRSSHGKNSKGSKITGIQAVNLPSSSSYRRNLFDKEVRLLISTNDSRIRLYNFYDRTIEAKFKGHENRQGQIHATFSNDRAYIITGSEDDRTYIWKTEPDVGDSKKKDRQDYEYFHSHKAMVTVAMFSPSLLSKHLIASGDPIFEISDPPAVYLSGNYDDEDARENDIQRRYLERLASNDGNIIITADLTGVIKIFRQDCAYDRRKQASDALSILQKKRLSGITNLNLSPTHSWKDTLSNRASRSLRGSSVRGSSPHLTVRSSDVPNISTKYKERASSTPIKANGDTVGNESPASGYGLPEFNSIRETSPLGSRNDSSRDLSLISALNRSRSSLVSSLYDAHHDNMEENSSDNLVCSTCGSADFKVRISADGSAGLFCKVCNRRLSMR